MTDGRTVDTVDGLAEARKKIDEIDREMARLFAARMEAARKVAAYKCNRGLPVRDPEREAAVLERGAELVDEQLRPYYRDFQEAVMAVSRRYQHDLVNERAALGNLANLDGPRGAYDPSGPRGPNDQHGACSPNELRGAYDPSGPRGACGPSNPGATMRR